MRSPFSIFRKHQKVAMVIVLVLVMITFVLGQALSQMSGRLPTSMLVALAAMAGAGLAAMFGVQTGKPTEYAMMGAVIFGAAAFVGDYVQRPLAAVETSVGNIQQEQLKILIRDRQIANRFVQQVFYSANPPQNIPMLQEFQQRQLQQFLFRFNYAHEIDEDVVFGYLMQHDADRMGIEVTDEAVNTFINQISGSKSLTRDDLKKIRMGMRLGEKRLFDVLRAELRARMAMQMQVPRDLATPDEYWRVFERLNVSQKLDVAAIPVESFVAGVADPTEDEMSTFFEQHKTQFPDQLGPGSPGFREPRRVRIAYLEANYEDIESLVGEISAEEIETYYEENKEQFRANTFGADVDTSPADQKPLNPPFAPETGPALGPSTNDGQESKKGEPSSDDSAQDKENKESKASDADTESEPRKKDGQSSQTPESDEPSSDKPPADDGTSSLIPEALRNGEQLALLQVDEKKEVESPEPVSANSNGEKPNNEKPVVPDAPLKPADEKPADDSDETSKGESQDGEQADKADPEPAPEYLPLDDDLREEIRDRILREKTLNRMKDVIDSATNDIMYDLRHGFIKAEGDESKLTPEQIAQQLNDYAAKNQLRYVETDLLSVADLRDDEKYPIGLALDPRDSGIPPENAQTSIQKLFLSEADDLYNPKKAEDLLTNTRYAFWKIEDQPDAVPTLDTPGVMEEVIQAWKQDKATPLAQTRAEELAELVRTSEKSMSTALGEQTVTGVEGSLAITTQLTGDFTWITQSTAPSTDPFNRPPPQLSDINAIKSANDAFMKYVFQQLDDGDVGSTKNHDGSVYYVVQVLDRMPSTDLGLNALREEFLRQGIFSGGGMFGGSTPYDFIIGQTQQAVMRSWIDQKKFQYKVSRFNTPAANTDGPLAQ